MNRSAFTLIDTLIAVTLLALLATAAVVGAGAFRGQTLASAARVLAADLRLARAAAVEHNTTWTVRLNPQEHSYELVHTGTGDAPRLPNLLAGGSAEYRVRLNQLGGSGGADNGVRLLGAVLKGTRTRVSEVAFGPLGGTGPLRTEDTLIVLTEGQGAERKALRLTVSWMTGQVWVDEPSPKEVAGMFGPTATLVSVSDSGEATGGASSTVDWAFLSTLTPESLLEEWE